MPNLSQALRHRRIRNTVDEFNKWSGCHLVHTCILGRKVPMPGRVSRYVLPQAYHLEAAYSVTKFRLLHFGESHPWKHCCRRSTALYWQMTLSLRPKRTFTCLLLICSFAEGGIEANHSWQEWFPNKKLLVGFWPFVRILGGPCQVSLRRYGYPSCHHRKCKQCFVLQSRAHPSL